MEKGKMENGNMEKGKMENGKMEKGKMGQMSLPAEHLQHVRSHRTTLAKWIEKNPIVIMRWLHDIGFLSQEQYFSLLERRPQSNQAISLLEIVTNDEESCRTFLQVLQKVQEYYCPELQNWLRNTFPLYIHQAPGPSGQLQSHKYSVLKKNMKIQGNLETSQSCCEMLEIRYTEVFITNENPAGHLGLHEFFVLANRRARIYEHNKHQKIKLTEILSPLEQESKEPCKVLVTGIAGIGKSIAVQRLMNEWAIGMAFTEFSCAVNFAFRELNLIEGPISFLDLLKQEHVHLQNIAEDMCKDPERMLVILDGLDEFTYPMNEATSLNSISKPAPIKDIVYSLIKGTLLSGATVLVTSRPRPSIPMEAFDRQVIILGFEESQVKEYCGRFFRDERLSEEVFQYIMKNDNLSGLSFIPLYCFIMCTALSSFFSDTTEHSFCDNPPKTMTEVYRCYMCTIIHHHMSKKRPKEQNTEPVPIVLCSPEVLREMKDTLFQLGELAYRSLLDNKILFYKEDLQKYGFDPTQLPDSFLQRIFVRLKGQKHVEIFSFFHMTLQEYLAALYCVMSMNASPEELTQSLDIWCFGIFPVQPAQSQLISTTMEIMMHNHFENLQMFSRFFMGLLGYRIEGKLKELVDGFNFDVLDLLTNWFKGKMTYEVNRRFLNLLHCLYELQQNIVLESVALEIDEVNLFKVTLNPADCAVLYYVLQHSRSELKTLNLGYTNIGIQGLRRLQPLLHRCQTLYLRYNSLDKEAAIIEADVLKSPICQVKSLLMCGNRIGSEGVRNLWEALSSNQTLQELYVDITGITDSGLDNLLPSLANNTTLRLLTIVGNNLSEKGKELLLELQRRRPGLKILSSFVGDMGLLQAYLDWAEELRADPQQMESVKNADALRNILEELGREEFGDNQKELKERAQELRRQISELLQVSSRAL
ncbi:NLR family CARD domain-containing protein 3-like [Discoglossus pictus]